MRLPRILFTFGLAGALATPPLAAQGFGVAPHVGTLGIGADIGISLTPAVGIRAGANLLPLEIDLTEADIEYTVSFPSPQFTATVDLVTPVGLRLTGGALFTSQDYEAEGQLTGAVFVGNVSYTSAEIGTLTGVLDYKNVAPYLGIGFGSPGRSRLGFFLDAGIAFRGRPELTLDATGGTLSSDPTFRTELAREQVEAQADLDSEDILRYYPVVSVGLSFRLGG